MIYIYICIYVYVHIWGEYTKFKVIMYGNLGNGENNISDFGSMGGDRNLC